MLTENNCKNDDRVDIVITWVNGEDPSWRSLKNKYRQEKDPGAAIDDSEVRYRDWGLLPYLLRGISKFAPWAGKIFLVTADQKPDFLAGYLEKGISDKLVLVSHRDFIPEEYLPTFSSRTIELNFHRIPGLSERFVYFNDDVLLTAPTVLDDFFRGDLPRDMHIQNVILPVAENMPPVQTNNMKIVNKYYSKKDFMKNHRDLWLRPCYGKNLIRNFLLRSWGAFTGFYDPHVSLSLTKKMMQEMWDKEFKALDDTCRRKFKSTEDVNIWLFRYMYLASGDFCPRPASFGKYLELTDDNGKIFSDISRGKYKVICLNDTKACKDFNGEKAKLLKVLEGLFPEKSPFEIDADAAEEKGKGGDI